MKERKAGRETARNTNDPWRPGRFPGKSEKVEVSRDHRASSDAGEDLEEVSVAGLNKDCETSGPVHHWKAKRTEGKHKVRKERGIVAESRPLSHQSDER